MLQFTACSKRTTANDVGFIAYMLDENDSDSATQQLNNHYQHGGGWRPMKGFSLNNELELCYPGDPPLKPLAIAILHQTEEVIIYPYAWVMVRDHNTGKFEVCRMD